MIIGLELPSLAAQEDFYGTEFRFPYKQGKAIGIVVILDRSQAVYMHGCMEHSPRFMMSYDQFGRVFMTD